MRHTRRLVRRIIWEHTFDHQFEDRQYAIDVFNQHVATVKQTVPADRLLVYDIKQGWEPLCQFLDVPVPVGKPFPHLNDTESFHKMMQRRTNVAQRIALGIGTFVVAGFS